MNNENNISFGIYRQYDSSSIVLISTYQKVLQILNGETPDPEVVEIFPTNFCNFTCPHCRFENYHGSENQYMTLSTVELLLNELSKRNVKAIELSGGGEPFEHPYIEDFMQLFVNGNFRLGIITNGYKLVQSKKLEEQILKIGNWIRFSVDAFTDETYQKVHGNKYVKYTVLKNTISRLVNSKREVLSVELKMLISNLNYKEYEIALNEAIELGVNCLQYKFLSNHINALDDTQMLEIKDKIQSLINNTKGLKVELVPPYRGKKTYERCLMTFLHPVIDWDGKIYICAFFEHRKNHHSIGNIHEGGFFKYWDDPNHRKIFESIDPSTCLPNCPMLRYKPIIEFIKSDSYRFQFI